MRKNQKIDKDCVLSMKKEGKTVKQISEKIGCSVEGVYRVLRVKNAYKPQNRSRFDETTETKIVQEYQSNVSIQNLAEKFGCEPNTIKNVIIRSGKGIRKGARIKRQGIDYVAKPTITSHGYRMIYLFYNDPYYEMTSKHGQILEHRYVMAKHLGRILQRKETVHHMDGNRTNNNIENLQLRTGHHGPGVVHLCLNCGSKNIIATPI
jgi:hypothetical protein